MREVTSEERRLRVAAGSNRKRDLQAVAPPIDWHQWIATNLPEEVGNSYVMSAVMQFWCRNPRHKRTEPNPDDVREFLRDRGEDNATLNQEDA